MKGEREHHYAIKILDQLNGLFDENCDNFIGIEELSEGDNATHFIHAVANIAPALIAQKITGQENGMLEFNHMANRLCFQYMKKED